MKKTIYICDCCKNEIQTPVQITPAMVEGGDLNRYDYLSESHFCVKCLDKLVKLLFNPVDIDALKASADEDKAIIDTLNAELEAAKAADPEELERMKAKNDQMAGKIAKQQTLIQSLRAEIDKLKISRGDEPPVKIIPVEDVQKPEPVKAKVKRSVTPPDKPAAIDKAAVYRMHRDGMSYQEIADRIDRTPSRVGQIVKEMTEKEAEHGDPVVL